MASDLQPERKEASSQQKKTEDRRQRTEPGALEGRRIVAPGGVLGTRGHLKPGDDARPERAEVLVPFQGDGVWIEPIPRALPWAAFFQGVALAHNS
jgi:hypothetical protein